MTNGKKPTVVDTHKKPSTIDAHKESSKKPVIEQSLSAKEGTKTPQSEKSFASEKSTTSEKSNTAEKQQNKKIEPPLTPIEKLAISLINNREPQTDPHPTATLSRFGLKTSRDVITFIRSPAGKSVLAEISDKMALNKAIQNQQQIKAREHDIMMHRLRAALFLSYLHKRAHAKAHVREEIEAQNKKAIENAKPHTSTAKASATKTQPNLALLNAIADYEAAMKANEEQHKAIKAEGIALASRLDQLEANEEMQAFKYGVVDSELADNVSLLELFENTSDPKSLEEANYQKEQIITRLQQLSDQIKELVDNDQYLEANVLIHQSTALSARLGELHDQSEVLNGKKYYTDEHGNEVDSFKKAHFVLDVHKMPALDETGQVIPDKHNLVKSKVHKHDGKCYLLEPGEDWETVNRDKAHEKFERQHPALLAVKQVVNHNKGLEAEETASQIKDVKGKIEDNKKDDMLLANQNVIMKAALSSAQSMLNQPELGLGQAPRPTPMQTVTGNPHTPKPSVSTSQVGATTLFFKNEMEKIKSVTPTDLLRIAQKAPGTNQQADIAFINDVVKKGKIDYTNPIPPQTMTFLLKNLPSIAGAPKTPGAMPSPEPTPTAPSPFLTKMKPH